MTIYRGILFVLLLASPSAAFISWIGSFLGYGETEKAGVNNVTVCDIPARTRMRCPGDRLGISEADCQALGCCYDAGLGNWNSHKCYADRTAKEYHVCNIHPIERLHCPGAYSGITNDRCSALGCCYDNSVLNAPWCFADKTADVYELCTVAHGERVLCRGAYAGILQQACQALGCCFDDRHVNVPSCFPYKTDRIYDVCNVDPVARESCPGGYLAITAQACHALGCCYDNRILNVPWCYAEKTGDGGLN